jgi:hypothetical protein
MHVQCHLFRVAGVGHPPGGHYRGEKQMMIVQTKEHGIISSDVAPEPVARQWARCNSLNTGDTYRVVRAHRTYEPYDLIAVYHQGEEVSP